MYILYIVRKASEPISSNTEIEKKKKKRKKCYPMLRIVYC